MILYHIIAYKIALGSRGGRHSSRGTYNYFLKYYIIYTASDENTCSIYIMYVQCTPAAYTICIIIFIYNMFIVTRVALRYIADAVVCVRVGTYQRIL